MKDASGTRRCLRHAQEQLPRTLILLRDSADVLRCTLSIEEWEMSRVCGDDLQVRILIAGASGM